MSQAMGVAPTRSIAATGRGRDRQRARVVRFRRLRLPGRDLRDKLLSARKPYAVAAGIVRRVRRCLRHAPAGGRAVRPYRRSRRPAHGTGDLGAGDGGAVFRHRAAAHVCRHWRARADAADPAAHDPGRIGRRRAHGVHRLSRRTQHGPPSRRQRQPQLRGCRGGHADWIAAHLHAGFHPGCGGYANLGLAHPVSGQRCAGCAGFGVAHGSAGGDSGTCYPHQARAGDRRLRHRMARHAPGVS